MMLKFKAMQIAKEEDFKWGEIVGALTPPTVHYLFNRILKFIIICSHKPYFDQISVQGNVENFWDELK